MNSHLLYWIFYPLIIYAHSNCLENGSNQERIRMNIKNKYKYKELILSICSNSENM